jgi:hypothetical protein
MKVSIFPLIVFIVIVVNLISKLSVPIKESVVNAAAEWVLKDPYNRTKEYSDYVLSCSSVYDSIFFIKCFRKNTHGDLKAVMLKAHKNKKDDLFKK